MVAFQSWESNSLDITGMPVQRELGRETIVPLMTEFSAAGGPGTIFESLQ
jgi:hypothetical protein